MLDYDDLLLYWAQIMIEGAVAHDIAARFDHVLVGEEAADGVTLPAGRLPVSAGRRGYRRWPDSTPHH